MFRNVGFEMVLLVNHEEKSLPSKSIHGFNPVIHVYVPEMSAVPAFGC